MESTYPSLWTIFYFLISGAQRIEGAEKQDLPWCSVTLTSTHIQCRHCHAHSRWDMFGECYWLGNLLDNMRTVLNLHLAHSHILARLLAGFSLAFLHYCSSLHFWLPGVPGRWTMKTLHCCCISGTEIHVHGNTSCYEILGIKIRPVQSN